MSFETLGLTPALVRALADLGYTQPTPIQSQAIPLALAGKDLMAGAQTGTGKTAAFALPLLQRLDATEIRGPRKIRALVLTPTRELAQQVHDSVRGYGKHMRLQSTTIYGGAGMQQQLEALRRGQDLLVATPGRLIDHLDRRSVDLSHVELLVLDEADRMLDMGFLPAIKRILTALPATRQTLLFSATFDAPIKTLAAQFLRNPVEVQVTPSNTVAATVTHRVHPVDGDRKRDLLLHILSQDSRRQTLIFARTKHGADRLSGQLEAAGIRSAAIHGNKTQGARMRALKDFKQGRITALVGTDVAARGLDIEQLPVVINYDLPMVAEDYVHRIGRTGRAGSEGLALSLVAPAEASLLRAIQRLLKQDLEMVPVAGFEPSRQFRMGNDGPTSGRPGGQQPPRGHARRPHANGPRQGHAGARGQSGRDGASQAAAGARTGRAPNPYDRKPSRSR
ncbi:MAG: DEAD/DEAH box helicase [Lysobacteraceae bacterium]